MYMYGHKYLNSTSVNK